MAEHPHETPGTEIRSISGYYTIEEEGRLPFGGRELLYVAGAGRVDNACCGTAGCRYVRVPGYVREWKVKTDGAGRPVSIVEPIAERDRQAVEVLLASRFVHAQVLFS